MRGRGGRDVQERLAAVAHRYRAPLLNQGTETFYLGIEAIAEIRILLPEIIGYDRIARRLGIGQEYAQVLVDLSGVGRALRIQQPHGLFLVGIATCRERRRSRLPQ